MGFQGQFLSGNTSAVDGVNGSLTLSGDSKHGNLTIRDGASMTRLHLGGQEVYIEADDVLTTSRPPSHTMKADEPLRASCAIIRKTVQPLHTGPGLIPLPVALR